MGEHISKPEKDLETLGSIGLSVFKKFTQAEAVLAIQKTLIHELVPIIRDFKNKIIRKWTFFKLIVAEICIILLDLGIFQIAQALIANFIFPAAGLIIIKAINFVVDQFLANSSNKCGEKLKKYIHDKLDEHEKEHEKDLHEFHDLYHNALKTLKHHDNPTPKVALKRINEQIKEHKIHSGKDLSDYVSLIKKKMIIYSEFSNEELQQEVTLIDQKLSQSS